MAYEVSADARQTLLRVTRAMFPHDRLPDDAYLTVVDALEADARADAEVAGVIDDGIAQFGDLAGSDAEGQAAALEAAQDSPLFMLVHAKAVVALYDQPSVWKAFGYEGPSTHLGGYVNRGFDDLDWLPDPPLTEDEAVAAAARMS